MSFIVLVAVAPGEHSEAALRAAARIATERGGALHAVSVVSGYDPFQRMEYAAERHRLTLDREVSALKARVDELMPTDVDLVAELHVLVGPAAKEILRLSQTIGASLVVVGRGKGLRQTLLGSVAEAVLRQARCSVLVVPD